MRLTNKIDFKLTKKRFRMLSSSSSRFRSIPKTLLVIPVISVITFMFCADSSNIYENLSDIELSETFPVYYYDVELSYDNGLLNDVSGEPYTGEQSTFDIQTDQLILKSQFSNGRRTQIEFFEIDENGVNRSTGVAKYVLNNEGSQVTITFHYTANDSLYLSSETVESDSAAKYSLYYENGKLMATWMLIVDRETTDVKYHDLFTEYDEGGNIIKQVRYEYGELVEIIK